LRSTQFSLREFLVLLRRRKKYILIPTIAITLISTVGAYLLPNRYESSTTILVQRDEILNPLISFEMAVTMATEDRLRTFNEIIFSQTTIQQLIDSLGLGRNIVTENQRQGLTEALRKNISVERRGSDSFRINYLDTDPMRAQQAAALLSRIFIQTTLRVEGQRNEQAVQFFQNKLSELRQKYETSQKEVLSLLQQRLSTMPGESKTVYTQVEGIEVQMRDLDIKLKAYKNALTVFKGLPDLLKSESGKQALYDLQREELPYIADLRTLLAKYDDYLRRYTPKYPEVQKVEAQLLLLLDRMKGSIENDMAHQESVRGELEDRRAKLLENIKKSSISERVDEDKESDFSIYRKLYDEMKIKLEQAEMARDLGRKGANQFIIIDPALVPANPSKPNRSQLVFGGLALGLFLGFLTIIILEILDSTVRYARDIEVYEKPIIAFITEGEGERL
jgi:succinoglycan biosynthesis transport protein ExoP